VFFTSNREKKGKKEKEKKAHNSFIVKRTAIMLEKEKKK
jgi:hypothetical protein